VNQKTISKLIKRFAFSIFSPTDLQVDKSSRKKFTSKKLLPIKQTKNAAESQCRDIMGQE